MSNKALVVIDIQNDFSSLFCRYGAEVCDGKAGVTYEAGTCCRRHLGYYWIRLGGSAAGEMVGSYRKMKNERRQPAFEGLFGAYEGIGSNIRVGRRNAY